MTDAVTRSPAGAHDEHSARGAHYDAVVIGAGISGLVSASVLLQEGAERVLVIDEYSGVGGNHIDRSYGEYTYDIGSLVFQDDSPLLEHFPEILPRYLPIDPSWGRINPQGQVTKYPFSVKDDLLGAGPVECLRLLLSASYGRVRRRPLRNARDYAERWLGARFLARSGLGAYMERFCGLPADLVDLEFAEKRMHWIAERASLRGLAEKLTVLVRHGYRRAAKGFNTQLARPREGFAHLYAPAVARLEQRGVTFLLGQRLERLSHEDGSFALRTTRQVITADRIVSTIPVEHALELCRLQTGADRLPTVDLISLFFSFEGGRGFPQPILYNFSRTGAWKRLTVHSDFYGRVAGREYFTVEVLGGAVDGSVVVAEDDFRRHVRDNGLFDGDLTLEGSHVLSHAYPLYTRGSGQVARHAVQALREFGVESLGRQGAFQYQPTARQSTLEAQEALAARRPPERGASR